MSIKKGGRFRDVRQVVGTSKEKRGCRLQESMGRVVGYVGLKQEHHMRSIEVD